MRHLLAALAVLLLTAPQPTHAQESAPPAPPPALPSPAEMEAARQAMEKARAAAHGKNPVQEIDPKVREVLDQNEAKYPKREKVTPKVAPELVAQWNVSRQFFESLRLGDIDGMASVSRQPFNLDGDSTANLDDFRKRWHELLEGRAEHLGELFDLQIFPVEEFVARHGAPPPRFAPLAVKGTFVALGNLDSRPTVLLLKKDANGVFGVYAFHD